MSFFFVFSFGLAKVAASLSLGFCFVFSKLPKFFDENNIHSYFFGTHRIGWQSASQPASRYDDAFALNVNSSKECLLYFAFYVNALEFAIQAFNQSFLYRQMTHTGTHTTASTMRIHREYHEHLNLWRISKQHRTHNEHRACFPKLVIQILQHNMPTKLCTSLLSAARYASALNNEQWAAWNVCNLHTSYTNRTNAKHFE